VIYYQEESDCSQARLLRGNGGQTARLSPLARHIENLRSTAELLAEDMR
jgi:hypothetical protein